VTANLASAQLKACESVIERGQQTFVEVGRALARIRDERLFREAGFHSFDDYCQGRWGMQRNYANKLISAGELGTTVPNERQARELRRVPEPRRIEVMQQAQQLAEEREQPVTAAVIREVAGGEEPAPKCCHCEIHCPIRYTRKGGLDG
jgi:hypothetical protein